MCLNLLSCGCILVNPTLRPSSTMYWRGVFFLSSGLFHCPLICCVAASAGTAALSASFRGERVRKKLELNFQQDARS